MVYKTTSSNNTSIYQISGTNVAKSLPDWLQKKRKQSLKDDLEYQNRVELIQDFEFSESSNKIQVSPDGQYAMATGTYKPQIHVYEFANLSLKFERHTNAENVDFAILSQDWTKSIHLQCDRNLEFHDKGGMMYRTRIPKFGRQVKYNDVNCDLLVAASGREIYRLNIEQGRFMKPFTTDPIEGKGEGVTSLDLNATHGLMAAGLEDGTVEFWDPRAKQQIIKIAIPDSGEITTVQFSKRNPLSFACGTQDGESLIYDLRTSLPLQRRDQGYGFPIKKIIYLDSLANTHQSDQNEDLILTSDKKIAKIWHLNTGKPYAAMEPSVDINDICHVPESGMFFMANESVPMHTYYIPQLGPSPNWCSFLDNITEEMEERPSDTIYSNYKFLTKEDVAKMNINHLVGTNVMRSYMHGYFIDSELYDKINLIANPNSIIDQRERDIRKRIEKERESRVANATPKNSAGKVKVNKEYAEKLRGKYDGESVLEDDRFKEVFEDPAFAIDVENHDYKQLNPVASDNKLRDSMREMTAAEEEEQEKLEQLKRGQLGSDEENSDSDSDSEDEEQKEKAKDKELTKKQEQKRKVRDKLKKRNLNNERANTHDDYDESLMQTTMSAIVGDDKVKPVSFGKQAALQRQQAQSNKEHRSNVRVRKAASGEGEITFKPASKSKNKRVEKTERKDYDGRRRAGKNAFRGM